MRLREARVPMHPDASMGTGAGHVTRFEATLKLAQGRPRGLPRKHLHARHAHRRRIYIVFERSQGHIEDNLARTEKPHWKNRLVLFVPERAINSTTSLQLDLDRPLPNGLDLPSTFSGRDAMQAILTCDPTSESSTFPLAKLRKGGG